LTGTSWKIVLPVTGFSGKSQSFLQTDKKNNLTQLFDFFLSIIIDASLLASLARDYLKSHLLLMKGYL
jgi:hypothetical protein